MIEQKRISLGSPWSPGGSIYVATSKDDLLSMAVDFEYIRLRDDNLVVTPTLHEQIEERVLREDLMLQSKIKSLSIPQKLTGLFNIQSKSDAIKYCRNLKITEFDLFLLIHNCAQIDFRHEAKFREHIPEGRDITSTDRDNLKKGGYKKYSSKLQSLLEFRKQSHVHWFENNNDWHLFYFDYSDTAEDDENHWVGPHIHYYSNLWTNSKKEEILSAFDERITNRSGYHVKFVPFQYPEFTDDWEPPVTIFGSQPMLLVFNRQLPVDPITTPVPTAHVATRGAWIQSIRLRPPTSHDAE